MEATKDIVKCFKEDKVFNVVFVPWHHCGCSKTVIGYTSCFDLGDQIDNIFDSCNPVIMKLVQ